MGGSAKYNARGIAEGSKRDMQRIVPEAVSTYRTKGGAKD